MAAGGWFPFVLNRGGTSQAGAWPPSSIRDSGVRFQILRVLNWRPHVCLP
jgi:hypothetical protein